MKKLLSDKINSEQPEDKSKQSDEEVEKVVEDDKNEKKNPLVHFVLQNISVDNPLTGSDVQSIKQKLCEKMGSPETNEEIERAVINEEPEMSKEMKKDIIEDDTSKDVVTDVDTENNQVDKDTDLDTTEQENSTVDSTGEDKIETSNTDKSNILEISTEKTDDSSLLIPMDTEENKSDTVESDEVNDSGVEPITKMLVEKNLESNKTEVFKPKRIELIRKININSSPKQDKSLTKESAASTDKEKSKSLLNTVKLININALIERGKTSFLPDKPEISLVKKPTTTKPSSNVDNSDASSNTESITIKMEVDDDYDDYMSKRDFLTSLNINAKESPAQSTEKRLVTSKSANVSNMDKVIDTVASTFSINNEGKEIVLKQGEKNTKFSGLKAKKPFKPKKLVTEEPNPRSLLQVNSTQKQIATNSVMFLAPTNMMNTLTVLPQSGLTTTTPMIMIPTSSIQNGSDASTNKSVTSFSLLPSLVQKSPASTGIQKTPVVVNGPSSSNNNSNDSIANASDYSFSNNISESIEQLNRLADISPDHMSKVVSEIFCRPPPKLLPRPPGVLSTTFSEGLPSSAGNVTAKINSISHRVSANGCIFLLHII